MSALKKKEDTMPTEERLASLESDVKYLRRDVTNMQALIQSLDNGIQNLRFDVQSFKTEVTKEFGAVRTEAADLRAGMNKEFGAVHVAIEALKTSIEKSKLWMLVTGVGVIMSTVITLAHALKLF